MADKEAVDLPSKVTPVEPGEAVPAYEVHTSGSSFAERKAAREAADAKAVESGDAENKSVAPKRTVKK